MESLRSKIIKIFLHTIRYNKLYRLTGDKLWDTLRIAQKVMKDDAPNSTKKKVHVTKHTFKNNPYFIIEPKRRAYTHTILYIYGGGYVSEMSSLHWKFLTFLSNATHYRIFVPFYPLVPDFNYQDVFQMLLPLYSFILEDKNTKDLYIIGDSSGGSIALALSQQIQQHNLKTPKKLIAICPSVDMSVSNKQLPAIAPLDPVLALPGMKDIGLKYAGKENPFHPLISPLYGSIPPTPPIRLFVATHDICYPDCELYYKKCITENRDCKIYRYPGMIHDWILLPLPESKKARNDLLLEILN